MPYKLKKKNLPWAVAIRVQVASSNDEGRQVHARELAGTLLWPVAIEGNSSVERMKESVSPSKKN